MKNNPESGEFCCQHIILFNNGKAIHFRMTLTPLHLLFLLLSMSQFRHISRLSFSQSINASMYCTPLFTNLNYGVFLGVYHCALSVLMLAEEKRISKEDN